MTSAIVLSLILVAILAAHAATACKTLIPYRFANADLLYFPFAQVMLGKISVGTPDQHFEVAIFTGNTLTWLEDRICNDCTDTRYDGTKSSTFKDLKKPVMMQYSDNDAAKGTWTKDTFHLGNVAVAAFPFCRAYQTTDFSALSDASGALGLGLGKQKAYESMLHRLSTAKNLDKKVFSIRPSPDGPEHAGDILVGCVDDSVDIHYTQIIDPHDWKIHVNMIKKGKKIIASKLELPVRVETSTPFIYLDRDIVEKIYQGTGATVVFDGLYVLPKEFPNDVTFSIGGSNFTVLKANMWVKELPKRVGMYRAAIQIADGDRVLGIPFIKSNHMVFDFGKRAIGIGEAKAKMQD